ncbi:NAD-dependent epimerase/dehydratase family protein [Chryseobacterium sp.]|jgi:nucleoside-diphosphate-sugar epimerase|uniref:NAD-dependent epimerase/dehydratase family protein n=1 Tax=Chryseobacterium sp. TaxID=1871047 RepID=UPI0028462492|nr:NAD-dependent epimerase/dehydratase family protein [Chryseobacterium sp.]MDR3022982.1 NAD-dependent epimerase/dehydratase family protein [Chryseobacterium sp.]
MDQTSIDDPGYKKRDRSMKKVCVTGATGLLGTNVIIKLLQNGYSVIALVRKKSSWLGEENENLKLVEADLSSDLSLLLKEIDFVIHIAAETRQNLISYDEYRKVNYEATVNLFTHAELMNVKKFLFVSTANTLGYGNTAFRGNEQAPQLYPFTHSMYAQSKLEAENYLLKNRKNTEVVIVNPTFMIGAYDSKPSSGKIIFWAWKKKLVFYPKGGKNFVHAEDAANGVLHAIKKGRNGEKYLLANENLSYKEFFKKINKITYQNPVMIAIPNGLLSFLGLIGGGLRKLKIKTNLNTSNMKALQICNYYSNQKSVNELGLHYQSVDKAIEDAIQYFDSNNKY